MYTLDVQSLGGSGTYSLTASGSQATSPAEPLPLFIKETTPSVVLTGDFNNDGNLDMAVGISNFSPAAGAIGVYLGNGDGTFQPAVFSGLSFSQMVAGDFDGDGTTDLAGISNDSGVCTLSVLKGNGDGTFKVDVQYVVGSQSFSMTSADFNGDGRIDLAVSSRNEKTVSVLLGNGDGTFQARLKFDAGPTLGTIVAGDFNGDGRADVAVVNPNTKSTVSVLIGHGDGTFDARRVFNVGVQSRLDTSGMLAADFNGDGRDDLAVINGGTTSLQKVDSSLSILLSNGDGTFQPQVAYLAGDLPIAIRAGDFDHDGKNDLAVATRGGAIEILSGKGDGTFLPPFNFTTGTTGAIDSPPGGTIAAGDFDGDGRTDLAAASGGSSNGPPSGVRVFLGRGNGSYLLASPPPGNTVGAFPSRAAAGDFNGDGRTDLAVADSTRLYVMLGKGDGSFAAPVTYATGRTGREIVADDFNGDGRTDLAVVFGGNNRVSVLLGNGDGTFTPAVNYAVGKTPFGMAKGDFNGDGRIDLAVTNSADNTVSVLLGKGDGTFASQATFKVGPAPKGVVAGDFNGDGWTDLAVADSGDSTVSILAGNGQGVFAPPAAYDVVNAPGNLVAADFNGDGHLDLAVACPQSSQFIALDPVSILLGNGDGTFRPHVEYQVGQNPTSIVLGDFNGDGRTDLAVSNFSGVPDVIGGGGGSFAFTGAVSILAGRGDGAFAKQVAFDTPTYLQYVVAGDFNNDGHLDFASVTSSDNSVSVRLGKGDRTFADTGQFAVTPLATPLVAHVNGDATLDVLVVDALGNILYRQGVPGQEGSFAPPVTVNPDTPSRDIAWLPRTEAGPLIASVDAHDDSVSLYAFRGGAFVKVRTLATGSLPAQVVAADLNHDGWTDLVVRNAGDGTLSVFFGTALVGPRPPQFNVLPQFLTGVTVAVGLGVSDVQAVDTTGGGRLDLVVTNKVTGQIGILRNLGNRSFGPLAPYRAGTGFSSVQAGGTTKVVSLDGTAGFAAGPLTPDGATGFVTINPGTRTLSVIAGLGGGRFANPDSIQTASPTRVVRIADLSGDGVNSLAVLTADGVNIYLGDGRGGFSAPVNYETGPDPTGLTVADLDHDGRPDLLVGNAYGDVLFLVGNGDGTFRPYTKADQGVALAVSDLTGDGKPDFVYANQGLDRVVVQYGAGGNGTDTTTVLGDHSSGLLAPGAVKLADLTGDGIKDLIVANSGSNNVLVYPGLGDGQFGPATNGGHGYFAGTNPTGIEVANLNGQPDLIVANAGSNDVSILLGQGSGANWTLTPGPRVKTGAGPVAVAVGDITGKGTLDLAVANQQANNVQVFPGIGGGFFSQTPTTYAVGQAPSGLFLGNFDGSGLGIAALNSGSNTVSLIGQNGVTQTINAGGLRPSSGFAGDFTGNGFTDLVVGNSGDGRFSLLSGGPSGLSLSLSTTSAAVPSPTSLSFAGVSDGVLSFYAASAGHEAASLLAFSLEGQGNSGGDVSGGELAGGTGQSTGSVLTAATTGAFQQAAQLLGLNGSALDLIAPLLTVSVVPGEFDTAEGTGEVALLANFLPSTGVTQALASNEDENHSGGEEAEGTEDGEEAGEAPQEELPAWEQLAVGLDQAWEELRNNRLEREGVDRGAADRAASKPDRESPTPLSRKPALRRRDQTQPRARREPTAPAPLPAASRPAVVPAERAEPEAVDSAIAELAGNMPLMDRPAAPPTERMEEESAADHDPLNRPLAAAVTLVSMETLARWIRSRRGEQARRARKIEPERVLRT
ncbi:MAG: VCBS repeat-containing protein [Isosphaeraceae bacterium]